MSDASYAHWAGGSCYGGVGFAAMAGPAINSRRVGIGAGAAALAGAGAFVAAQHRLRRRVEADPERASLSVPISGRSIPVTAADGTGLHAEAFGPESAPTVVLIHGWTESIQIWIHVVRALTDAGLRVVAHDLRGHGQSERATDGDYRIERFGEDVESVLAATLPDGGRAVVAGHSLGAMSIASWAEHHDVPRRASAAALIHTGVGELIAESLLVPLPKVARAYTDAFATRAFMGSRAPLPELSTPVGHAMIRYIAFGPTAGPAQVAFFERMVLDCRPDVRADVGLAISQIDLYHALANLTVPTAVIAGERDRLTPPSHARRMAELVPELHSLKVLDGVGHMGPLERPDEITSTLLELARVGASAGALV